MKPSNADHFTIHEVIGYRLRRAGTVVVSRERAPDARWFGAHPELLRDVRGPGVDALITRIEAAVLRYPYATSYHVWPGPNSNTFTAFVLREVPELRVDLPPTAIGKDYLGIMPVALHAERHRRPGERARHRGIAAGWEEGLELNVLGLTFGLDPRSLSIKLPLLGRIGPSESEPVDPRLKVACSGPSEPSYMALPPRRCAHASCCDEVRRCRTGHRSGGCRLSAPRTGARRAPWMCSTTAWIFE